MNYRQSIRRSPVRQAQILAGLRAGDADLTAIDELACNAPVKSALNALDCDRGLRDKNSERKEIVSSDDDLEQRRSQRVIVDGKLPAAPRSSVSGAGRRSCRQS